MENFFTLIQQIEHLIWNGPMARFSRKKDDQEASKQNGDKDDQVPRPPLVEGDNNAPHKTKA